VYNIEVISLDGGTESTQQVQVFESVFVYDPPEDLFNVASQTIQDIADDVLEPRFEFDARMVYPDPCGRADTDTRYANACRALGDADTAELIQTLDALAWDATENNNLVEAAGLHTWVALAWLEEGNDEEAIMAIEMAYDAALYAGDPYLLAGALHNRGVVFYAMDDWQLAESHLRIAAQLREEMDDIEGIDLSWQQLERVYEDFAE
ncbi:MAG: hypothetical protein AAF125_26695, partial [Chloroflexota bacterium]